MQYSDLASVLEMLPTGVQKGRSVSGLAFSCSEKTFAVSGASMSIKIYDYDAVLAGGTRCVFSVLHGVSRPARERPSDSGTSQPVKAMPELLSTCCCAGALESRTLPQVLLVSAASRVIELPCAGCTLRRASSRRSGA
jgi:hypothetical protein